MSEVQKKINSLKWLFNYFAPAITVFIPFIIYFGIRYFGYRYLFSGLLFLYLLRIVFSMKSGVKINQIFIFIIIAALLCSDIIFNRAFLALYTPVLINLGLLFSFGSTLFFGPPIIETFARKQVKVLSEPEVIYCRKLTILWSAFFLINGSVSYLISSAGNMEYWVIYNGFISYVMIALFFSIEMTYRYYRFRNYGNTFVDSFYKRIFKPEKSG